MSDGTRIQIQGGKTCQQHNDFRGKIIKLLCSISVISNSEEKLNKMRLHILSLFLHFNFISYFQVLNVVWHGSTVGSTMDAQEWPQREACL